MGSSRKAVAALAVIAATVAACDALLGIGDYSKVDCAFDCSVVAVDASEAGAATDTGLDVFDAGNPDAGDGDAGEVDSALEAQPGDGAVDAPSVLLRWAQWPMPNPDAAIAPEASTLLPNTMAYDAGADGGSTTVLDLVTNLTWSRPAHSATTIGAATTYCSTLPGTGWHVPTRIQLVSLIDFTQPSSNPTIDVTTFPGTPQQRFWTSSTVPGDGGVTWVVDFGTGLTSTGGGTYASNVLCVREP